MAYGPKGTAGFHAVLQGVNCIRRLALALGLAAVSLAHGYVRSGNTYQTDGTVADINSAVGAADAGAVIAVPAGTFVWGAAGEAILLNKAVTLQGAGVSRTTIDLSPAAPGNSTGTVQIFAAATVTGFTIEGNGAAVPFSVSDPDNDFRITAITYNAGSDAAYFCYVAAGYGLIDSCTITSAAGNDELVFVRGPSDSWQTADSLGTADAVYLEDCVFNGPGSVCDANANARVVVRFCTINGAMKVDAHGFASNTPRGARQIEVYENKWTATQGYFPAVEIRGGTGMVWGNTSLAAGAWYFLSDYGYQGQWPNFNNTYQTPVNYPIQDQIGVGPDVGGAKAAGGSDPLYSWGNLQNGGGWPRTLKAPAEGAIALFQQQKQDPAARFAETDIIQTDRDAFMDLTTGGRFDGSSGVGTGTAAQMKSIVPTRTGVGFWAADQGSWNTKANAASGQLYVWDGARWALKYTPYTYPHPLRAAGGTGSGAPPLPINLPVLTFPLGEIRSRHGATPAR